MSNPRSGQRPYHPWPRFDLCPNCSENPVQVEVGATMRFELTKAALIGLLSNVGPQEKIQSSDVAADAVRIADATLEALGVM